MPPSQPQQSTSAPAYQQRVRRLVYGSPALAIAGTVIAILMAIRTSGAPTIARVTITLLITAWTVHRWWRYSQVMRVEGTATLFQSLRKILGTDVSFGLVLKSAGVGAVAAVATGFLLMFSIEVDSPRLVRIAIGVVFVAAAFIFVMLVAILGWYLPDWAVTRAKSSSTGSHDRRD